MECFLASCNCLIKKLMTLMTFQQQLLRQEILEVFPKVDPPHSDNITSDDYGESLHVRLNFSGVSWWLAKNKLIDENYDKLPLLTSEAFHYYLPAFLLHSLEWFDPDNLTLEFTIYGLSPTKTSRDDPWFSARLIRFTPYQIHVVRKFLNCILSDPVMYSFYKNAERGLNKFWT